MIFITGCLIGIRKGDKSFYFPLKLFYGMGGCITYRHLIQFCRILTRGKISHYVLPTRERKNLKALLHCCLPVKLGLNVFVGKLGIALYCG